MKTILASILLAMSVLAAPQPPLPPILLVTPNPGSDPNDGTLTLSWGNNNAPSSNFVVLIQVTTNLSLVLSNWPFVTNISGLRTNITFTNGPVDTFYSGGLSNARGYVPFTNVLLHPAPLQPDYLSGRRGTN